MSAEEKMKLLVLGDGALVNALQSTVHCPVQGTGTSGSGPD